MNRPVVAEPALLAEAAGDVMCAPSAVTMRREGRRRIPGKRSSCGCLTKLKEECCVKAAVFDSSVSGSVVLQPAACLCSVNATAHAQIRRLELCTFSAQFSPFLLPFIAPAPDEAPTILSVTPHTTTSVLIRWQVSGRQFVLCFIVCKKRFKKIHERLEKVAFNERP